MEEGSPGYEGNDDQFASTVHKSGGFESEFANVNGDEGYDHLDIDSAIEAAADDFINFDSHTNEEEEVNLRADSDVFGGAESSKIPKETQHHAPPSLPSSPPDTGTTAEVILITTSLGSVRRQFFSSRKAQHFLDCKGVVYCVIDANSEVAQGAGLKDSELMATWRDMDILAKADSSSISKVLIPQILIDGVSVGDETALQDLEEDGDLDWILARAACPACLNERQPHEASCSFCHVEYRILIDFKLISEKSIHRCLRGIRFYDEEAPAGGHERQEAHFKRSSIAGITFKHEEEGQGITYESLFGESPPPD